MARLLSIGQPCARPVAEAVDIDDLISSEPLFQTLEELGPAALDALAPLWRKSAKADYEMRRRILDCIVSIAPHTGTAFPETNDRVIAELTAMLRSTDDAEARERIAEVRKRARSLSVLAKILTSDRSTQNLIEIVTTRGGPFLKEMAATLLSHATDRTPSQTHLIETYLYPILMCRNPRQRVSTSVNGEEIDFGYGPKSHRKIGSALIRLGPCATIELPTRIYALKHGLPHERWRSIEVIRRDHLNHAQVQPALRRLAYSQFTERTLRCEAITLLGLLDKASARTRATLKHLSRTEDKAVSARAKAALRLVEPTDSKK